MLVLTLLAETIAVDGVTLSTAAVGAAVSAVTGYATLRANSKRNTERIDKIDSTELPTLQTEIKALHDELSKLREWQAYQSGKEKGRSARSHTRGPAEDVTPTRKFTR